MQALQCAFCTQSRSNYQSFTMLAYRPKDKTRKNANLDSETAEGNPSSSLSVGLTSSSPEYHSPPPPEEIRKVGQPDRKGPFYNPSLLGAKQAAKTQVE
ncbi:hypothetical protein TNIN_316211 [Trichonephila inaurata madagascariensis]|uniref:Uncharacterized protein n=1 Tax=Trichonephila inaurata madagascariensis TaxID=2747483 RepID=A0A8X6XBG2_9ARAC|nr:hypothetical protein TNIN_316211 [Trichonephila inaurata madagascariensis]